MANARAVVARLVDNLISRNNVVVFSKSYCPFCLRTKATFDALKQPYTALELDLEKDGEAIQEYLYEKTKQTTVPNIFIKQRHFGGNSDLQAALERKKLILPLESEAVKIPKQAE
ncbi:glutaredoxin [Ramicandelaber brevisporus]|nr:glutaredoxin [Ramicandelaber brevisporus]